MTLVLGWSLCLGCVFYNWYLLSVCFVSSTKQEAFFFTSMIPFNLTINSLHSTCEKLKLRDVKQLTQSHTGKRWQVGCLSKFRAQIPNLYVTTVIGHTQALDQWLCSKQVLLFVLAERQVSGPTHFFSSLFGYGLSANPHLHSWNLIPMVRY